MNQHGGSVRRRTVLIGLVCSLSFAGGAAHSEEAKSVVHPHDTVSQFEGRIIDTIVIEPRNIYDTSDPQYSGRIFRLANSLHIVTRRKVVRHELLFKVGDPYTTEVAEEVGRNLRSSHAINDAWVAPEELPDGRLLVRVVTVDRWSLIGGFQFRREGNRTNYRFGFEERNLLGHHQFLVFDYYLQEQDGNYVVGRFFDRRLWGFPISLRLEHSGDPLGSSTSTKLSHPYYNLAQHWAYAITQAFSGGRTDFYHDTVRVASTYLAGDYVNVAGEYRWGPSRSKFALGAEYQYVYDSYYGNTIYQPHLADSIVIPQDSVYHSIGAILEFSSFEFARVQRILGMRYFEDLTLGFTARLEYARAFGPHFREFAFDDIKFSAGYTAKVGGSVLLSSYERSYVLRENAKVRQDDNLLIRYYNTTLPVVTLAVRSSYRSVSMADRSNLLYLGGVNGLRGYDQYFRTGSRMHVLNSELRFYPQLEFLSIIFGGAVFADFGRTWKEGEREYLLKDYYRSFGVGLRMSLEKTSRGELIRFDLARSQDGKWQLSVDSHQYF